MKYFMIIYFNGITENMKTVLEEKTFDGQRGNLLFLHISKSVMFV